MRSRHWGFTVTMAVVCSLTAVSFTGCSSSGLKMPSLAWWSKKSPDPALADSSTTGLPAPPSATATPQHAPSYASNGRGAAGSSSPSWNSTPARTVSTAGGGYAAASGASSYRNPATSPGGYQPAYGQAGSTAGAPAAYGSGYGASTPQPGSTSPSYAVAPSYTGSPSNAAASGSGGPSASKYLLNGAASPPYTGRVGSMPPAPTTSDAGGAYATSPASRSAGSGSSGAYGTGGVPRSVGGYPAAGEASSPRSGSTASAPGGSLYGSTAATEPVGTTAGAEVASAPFQPGSTGRETPYSDQINMPRRDEIQPAGYAGEGGQPPSYPATGYPSTEGSRYGGGNYGVPATATPGAAGYPSTYQR